MNLLKESYRMILRKADLLAEVVWQQGDHELVPLLIEDRHENVVVVVFIVRVIAGGGGAGGFGFAGEIWGADVEAEVECCVSY